MLLSRWQAWNTFVSAQANAGFMQSSWWADFQTTIGRENFGTILRDGEAIVGGAVVLKFTYAPDKCYYYIPEGPVLPKDTSDAAQAFNNILTFIEEKRKQEALIVSHLRIEPRWHSIPDFMHGFQKTGQWFEPRDTLCIDLSLSETELLAQMKPKGRYNIGVARKCGVSIVEDTSLQGLEDFLRIYKDTASRQDMSEKNSAYFRNLASMLHTLKCGALFFAEYQGIRLATALVVYFGQRATYFYGASLALHRNVMAPYLLHFEIMCKAKALGYEWYDLWGVNPQNQPNHPWANISAFKRKLGGQELAFVPTLDYVYDSVAYRQYRNKIA
ncbi:MAG: peptidoglycan bridge formation glycyltransferase FemA/FemB family protein [Methyloglobulus sp.]|nr:peptidoglycan bridge formation glycyltransferase FemA/FemB family protein [Methyloglobulus sp.]